MAFFRTFLICAFCAVVSLPVWATGCDIEFNNGKKINDVVAATTRRSNKTITYRTANKVIKDLPTLNEASKINGKTVKSLGLNLTSADYVVLNCGDNGNSIKIEGQQKVTLPAKQTSQKSGTKENKTEIKNPTCKALAQYKPSQSIDAFLNKSVLDCGTTPLEWAITSYNYDAAKAILDKRPELANSTVSERGQQTMLEHAINICCSDKDKNRDKINELDKIADLLIEKGANTNVTVNLHTKNMYEHPKGSLLDLARSRITEDDSCRQTGDTACKNIEQKLLSMGVTSRAETNKTAKQTAQKSEPKKSSSQKQEQTQDQDTEARLAALEAEAKAQNAELTAMESQMDGVETAKKTREPLPDIQRLPDRDISDILGSDAGAGSIEKLPAVAVLSIPDDKTGTTRTLRVHGKIVDEQGDELPSAHLVLIDKQEKQIKFDGCSTNLNGEFNCSFNDIPDGTRVKISYVGHETQILPLNSNMGTITLKATTLAEVKILECKDSNQKVVDGKCECIPCVSNDSVTCKLITKNDKCTYETECKDDYENIQNNGRYDAYCFEKDAEESEDTVYKINYELDDGNIADDAPKFYVVGKSIELNQTPTKSGCLFAGWCTDSNKTDCVATPTITAQDTGNKTFYAKWEGCKQTKDNQTSDETVKKIQEAQAKYDAAKEKETSFENRMLGGASMATTGLGAMQLAEGLAEKSAGEDAERDMAAYLETFKCNLNGNGKTYTGGTTGIETPGANQLITLYQEYVDLAADLKERKTALGMRPGIEAEVKLDKANTGLYDNVGRGIENGTYASLYRASKGNENDTAKLADAKESSANRVKYGAIAVAGGVAAGIAGNSIINKEQDEDVQDEDVQDEDVQDDEDIKKKENKKSNSGDNETYKYLKVSSVDFDNDCNLENAYVRNGLVFGDIMANCMEEIKSNGCPENIEYYEKSGKCTGELKDDPAKCQLCKELSKKAGECAQELDDYCKKQGVDRSKKIKQKMRI